MKHSKLLLNYLMLSALITLSSFNSCVAKSKKLDTDINFVASTPGDDQIKSLLAIPPDTKVDFIRWDLILSNTNETKQTFILSIVFGESQPNTLGFKNNGNRKTIEGQYSISVNIQATP